MTTFHDLALDGAKLMQEIHELQVSDPNADAFVPTVWRCEDARVKLRALIASAESMVAFARTIQIAKESGRTLNEFRADVARVGRERGLNG